MVEAGHKLVVLHVDSVEVLLALRREIGPALTIRVRVAVLVLARDLVPQPAGSGGMAARSARY